MLGTKMQAELTLFTINTSIVDILTLRSVFNPYPEQAGEGMLVSRMSHPTTNPLMSVKYLKTGNVYPVSEPISYPVEEFNTPSIGKESDAETYQREDGTTPERWMTLEQFYGHLSHSLVTNAMFEGSHFDEALAHAVVKQSEPDSVPTFYQPDEAYLRILAEALNQLKAGELTTAWALAHAGFNVGAYKVGDDCYSDAAYEVFQYTYHDLVKKACITAEFDHPYAARKRGVHTVLDDVASEVHAFAVLSIKMKVLVRSLSTHQGAAREHIQRVLGDYEKHREEVVEKLAARNSRHFDSPAANYYLQATGYFVAHGILL